MTIRILILLMLQTFLCGMRAQNKSGDVDKEMSLDSVIVHGTSGDVMLRSTADGTLRWSMTSLDDLPKILGNADPLHYAQMLPGVSTNGEYDAGLHILGCESSHNYVSINGSPLFSVQHILGIFSVFNAPHFERMSLRKAVAYASSPSRLGASVDMQTSTQRPDSVTGELSVGLISSQGTIRLPVTRRSHLTVSFRGAYLNLLYGSLLDTRDSKTRYSFYDANINYCHRLDDHNTLLLDLYLGNDDADILQKDYNSNMKIRWDNELAAVKWLYDNGRVAITDNLYFSRLHSRGEVAMDDLHVGLPSGISGYGNCLTLRYKGWETGLDCSMYDITPQQPDISSSFINMSGDMPSTHSAEYSIFLDKTIRPCRELAITAGIRGTVYDAADDSHARLSPSLSAIYTAPSGWDMSLSYSYRHQYLHQTGLTSLNTPLEFWLGSGTYGLQPQSAHSLSLTGHYALPGGYDITLECYSRWLDNQTEYNANFHSFFSGNYSLEGALLHGKGHNYGANIVVAKNRGLITGWVSYAYSRALRTYDSMTLRGTFPASHERMHEVNAVAVARPGKRWSVGLTAVFATGTPYTAPLYYHILQEHLIPQFSEHNALRLKPYFRLDASANYELPPTRAIARHGINLSIYNVTGYENELFHYMKADAEHYRYKTMTFALRIMPSVSYYMKF